MANLRSQNDHMSSPKTKRGSNVPEDLAERVAKLLSVLLTAQYGSEYGVTITVLTKKMLAEREMAAERAKAAGA